MAEGTTAGDSGAAGTGETGAVAADGTREASGAAADRTREAGGAAVGGRWVDVAPDRLARWVASFAERHGTITAEPGRRTVSFRAADGAAAECHPPFPPMPAPGG